MHPLNTLAIAWFSFATVAATSAAISRCAGPPSTQACTMLWHDGTWRCLIGAAAYEPPLPAHFASTWEKLWMSTPSPCPSCAVFPS